MTSFLHSRLEKILTHILGDLSPEQVEGLDLDARYLSDMGYPSITRIEGLERFVALEELSLAGQQLLSWQGLPALPLLSTLILSDNELQDFDHAPDLPALTDLDLSLNMLMTLDGMPEWDQLRSLNLGHNQIPSLEALQGRQINRLVLSGNKRLKDLRTLTSLSGLKSLFATSLNIADWSWIRDSGIEEISVTPTSSSSVSSLVSESISRLTLSLQKCEAVLDLTAFGNLTDLSMSKGREGLTIHLPDSDLRHLQISHSSLQTLPTIPRSSQLESLDLRHNLLTELPSLSSFPKLKDVYLSGNPLSTSFFSKVDLHPEVHWHL